MGKRHKAAEPLHGGDLGGGAGPGPFRRASRFRAVRTTASDGREFASKAEARRYEQLLLLERSGHIGSLTCHPIWNFEINGRPLRVPWGKGGEQRKARYTADFSYIDHATGGLVVEDVKGVLTPDAGLRIGLMDVCHGITVRLVTRSRRR